MQIFVLNLARSADRLVRMDRQLSALGAGYRRIEAYDGRTMEPADRRAWAEARPRDGTPWLPGQIGCFRSHLQAWRQARDDDDPFVLVLEDDMHLSAELGPLIRNTAWIPDGIDVVRLETTLQGVRLGRNVTARPGSTGLRPLRSRAWGAGAYILGRDVALWLAASPSRFHVPPDILLFNKDLSPIARALRVVQSVPALAIQDKYLDRSARLGFVSEIDTPETLATEMPFVQHVKALMRPLIGKTVVPFGA